MLSGCDCDIFAVCTHKVVLIHISFASYMTSGQHETRPGVVQCNVAALSRAFGQYKWGAGVLDVNSAEHCSFSLSQRPEPSTLRPKRY
mgnify:CR=1 FL=1